MNSLSPPSGLQSRPRILTATDYYRPGFRGGGPIKTISHLVDHLGDLFEFRIATRDRDLGDAQPYPGISVGAWEALGNSLILYQSPHHRRLRDWVSLLNSTQYDLLYLNSLFSRTTIRLLLLRRLRLLPDRPTILAPRGELSPGAMGLKRWRKQLFLTSGQRLGLFGGLTWQASTERERTEIREALRTDGKLNVQCAPNLPPARRTIVDMDRPRGLLSGSGDCNPKLPGEARIIFVSRIARKKNLHYALDVLRQLRGRVSLDIYGPREDMAYWLECEAAMASLPSNVTGRYRGEIEPAATVQLFAQYHLFLFPTLSENFGHVVLEALMGGCPVLLSNTTPWRDLDQSTAGWDLPLEEPARFVATAQHLVDMTHAEHDMWREGARALAALVSADADAVEANRNLFTRALGARHAAEDSRNSVAQ